MKTEAEKEAMQPQAKEHMANTGSWRRQERPLLPGPLEGARPCHRWISDFWPPEPGGNPFLLLEASQSVAICYSSLWKLIHQADGKTSINPLVTEVCRMWCCENCKWGGGLPVGGGPTRGQE